MSWGAGSEGLLMGYRAMDLPGLDNGCLAFGTSAKTTLPKLEIIQASALHIYDRAFLTFWQKKKNQDAYLKLLHCLMLLHCIAL